MEYNNCFELNDDRINAAKEAGRILGAEVSVRLSPGKTRAFFEAVRGKGEEKEDACVVAEKGDMDTFTMSGSELAAALDKEFKTRQRSRDFTEGKVSADVFGGYVPPEVLASEDYTPRVSAQVEEEAER